MDGDEITRAVEEEHDGHRDGQHEMQRTRDAALSRTAVIFELAPRIERAAGKREQQTQEHGRQTELLEAENRRDDPQDRGAEPEFDRAARRPVRTFQMRRIPPQEPHRDAREPDRDEVREISRGDEPDRIADEKEPDRSRSGKERCDPRDVALRMQSEYAWNDAVIGELRQRSRRAG